MKKRLAVKSLCIVGVKLVQFTYKPLLNDPSKLFRVIVLLIILLNNLFYNNGILLVLLKKIRIFVILLMSLKKINMIC